MVGWSCLLASCRCKIGREGGREGGIVGSGVFVLFRSE